MQLCPKTCEEYYKTQSGGGINYFSGAQYQRGAGWFGNIKRFITPLAVKAGKYIGKKLLNTGSNVFSDIVRGRPLKEAARSRFRDLKTEVKEDFYRKLKGGGGGIKRKRKTKVRHKSKNNRATKKQRDIFS